MSGLPASCRPRQAREARKGRGRPLVLGCYMDSSAIRRVSVKHAQGWRQRFQRAIILIEFHQSREEFSVVGFNVDANFVADFSEQRPIKQSGILPEWNPVFL